MDRKDLKNVKRIVVKVGTSLLTDADNHVDPAKIKQIVSQVAAVKTGNRDIILVTSGAVGIGLGIIGSKEYPQKLTERQALAAMGQSRLMHMYETCFNHYNIPIGQVILTAQDIHTQERFLNARNTFLKLLEFGAIPIVNENDTVSTEEIQFGDNDTLSANVALTAEADLLVILTDTDGLFNINPKKNITARRISIIRVIDASVAALAQGTDKSTAIGGMETKIKAAKMATLSGIPVVIAGGSGPNIIQEILDGSDVGTFFVPAAEKLSQKKRWIAHTRKKRGGIVIDEGCRQAVLKKGKSILPVGVVKVKGQFKKGDSIVVYDLSGKELGTGLSNYDSSDCEKILGQKFKDEIIHCDNLVLHI